MDAQKVVSLIAHNVIYSPIKGSSYVELPKKLRRLQSLLNIRNLDFKYLLRSCLASVHPLNSPLVSDYQIFEQKLNMKGINYPVSINQINTFEKQNLSISINVFTYEDQDILPLCITKHHGRLHHVNLLLLSTKQLSLRSN